MDFVFNSKSPKGISILLEDDHILINIPIYIYENLSMFKLLNWINEIQGNIKKSDNKSDMEIIVNKNIAPSDIYRTFYHFVE